ncbi:MAG: O-antigen ligase family protein [Patescibacteria group bacterium]
MLYFFQQFVNSLTKTKYYLIVANVLLVFFLILLYNLKVLPMRLGDFVFFSLIYLIFALYRPGWSFLFFVGTIALENINLAPESLGIFIRPYQIIGALTIFSLLLRHYTKRLNFELVKLKWFDYVVGIFIFAGFLSSIFALDKGATFKQSIILLFFVALYWLVRNYIQTLEDLKKVIPFFLGSSVIVVFYGIWQNIRFVHGLNSFEVMLGRPNATFTEADWLGIYLVILIAVIYLIIYQISNSPNYLISNQIPNPNFQNTKYKILNTKYFIPIALYLLLISVFILLILTVSRSAWLGAGFITLVFLKAILTNFSFRFREWRGKELMRQLIFIAIALILSFGIVYFFKLTNFQLFNRAQSTSSGLQKITVACESDSDAPEKIGEVSELEQYGCSHINLEEINQEREEGFEIREIYRTDPNVNIRSQIYQKSVAEIKKHPIFGIGWGNISNVLGKDERGTGLNSSNIFLEVWLGSGILGLLAFLTIWVYIFVKSVVYCVRRPHTKSLNLWQNDNLSGNISDDKSTPANDFGVGVNFESKIIGILLFLMFFAILVPNMFNAGVFLGVLWLFFAVATSL